MNVEERGCEKVDYDNGDKLTGFKYWSLKLLACYCRERFLLYALFNCYRTV